MATTTQLAERAEVHKSCKSLETLLNVFNDYCEAAGAVVTLQKKLSKALKEMASLKATGEIAANAFNASASIFESLSEIDAKYAKLVDKEYDTISSEVKKWFKKLAKEEKAHDERILNVNVKIKQAGQIYEKKAKKNARDAGDEHSRYINLISSLGPEISQEKYNHSLMVTQRHTSTTYSVAACLARIADAEWLRTCEGVKRFAPTIGFLGEYRAYCEGGWTGLFPKEVPDVDATVQAEAGPITSLRSPDTLAPFTYRNAEAGSARESVESRTPSLGTSSPSYYREEDHAKQSNPTQEQNNSTSAAPSSFDPLRQLTDPTTGSVRSLSAFPAPPTHFPPPLRQQSSHGQPSRSPSQVSFPTSQRPFDSQNDITTNEGDASSNSSPEIQSSEPPRLDSKPLDSVAENEILQPISSRSQTLDSSQTESSSGSGSLARKGDSFDETEYKPRATASNFKAIERTDTGASNGSIVAAMRNRYSYNSGTSSPPPRDIPRLPMSVNDLASRYGEPSSPRAAPRSSSPQMSQPRPSIDSYLQNSSTPVEELSSFTGKEAAVPRRRPVDQLELQEKEQQLRAREREIEMKARELERERSNLINARSNMGDGATPRSGLLSRSPPLQSTPLRPRERTMSQNDLSPSKRSVSPYLHSPGHLLPPSPGIRPSEQYSDYNPSRTSSEHPDYCGCEKCTNAKYNSPSPASISPTSPIKASHLRPVTNEKPKGWMRRLSMPIVVGNAFLDSKKNHSTQNLGGKGLSSFDSKKNASTTTLGTGVTEDGRIASNGTGVGIGRRSYDVANRSSTNLGLGRR